MTATLPPAAPVRRRTLLVGTGFAVAVVFMYFAGLFGVYLGERSEARRTGDWLPEGITIELTPGTMATWTLLLSLVTMAWAVWAIRRDDRSHALLALGITGLFGLAVINQTVWQYIQMELSIDNSTAELLIYIISGSYLALLIASLLFLLLSGLRAAIGQYGSQQSDGIEAAAILWYAMVTVYFVIWIAIWIAK